MVPQLRWLLRPVVRLILLRIGGSQVADVEQIATSNGNIGNGLSATAEKWEPGREKQLAVSSKEKTNIAKSSWTWGYTTHPSQSKFRDLGMAQN